MRCSNWTTLANFSSPQEGATASGGWKEIKIRAHLGFTYLDAELTRVETERENFLRPLGGLEVWKGGAQIPHSRLMADLGWVVQFKPDQGSDGEIEEVATIEDILVASVGVRFFYHRYGTLDIGARYQSDYDGVTDSTIHAKLRLSMPTHLIRDRIIGT